MLAMDDVNRRTWRSGSALQGYGKMAGFMDQGERLAFSIAVPAGSRPRLLDIGVGGGRTAALLAPLASRYVGIDYVGEMVERARRNRPGLDFAHGDARDLATFASGSFDVVVFSCNGIDSVDPAGRAAVMAEAARVLGPGGHFVFSTFHRDWEGFSRRTSLRRIGWTPNPIRLGLRTLRFLEGSLVGAVRLHRLAALERRDDEHAVLLHWAHDFGILVYATTPDRLARQLAHAGFESPPLVIGADGERIVGPAAPTAEYMHVIARKPYLS